MDYWIGIGEAASRGVTEGLAAAEAWIRAIAAGTATAADRPRIQEQDARGAEYSRIPASIDRRGEAFAEAFAEAFTRTVETYYRAIRPAIAEGARS